MDAVKFYNEAKRICKYYKHCAGCIADVNDDCAFDMAAAPIGTDEVVALVEQWAKEHPRKTRQSVFLEHYPEAKRSEDGVLTIASSGCRKWNNVENAKRVIIAAGGEAPKVNTRLQELVKADEEGRVVVLPCRVGDTLFQLSSAYTECTVYGVRKDNYCCEGCEVPCDSHKVIFIDTIRPNSLVATIRCFEDLGKTVFRTREEAEKALEAKLNSGK